MIWLDSIYDLPNRCYVEHAIVFAASNYHVRYTFKLYDDVANSYISTDYYGLISYPYIEGVEKSHEGGWYKLRSWNSLSRRLVNCLEFLVYTANTSKFAGLKLINGNTNISPISDEVFFNDTYCGRTTSDQIKLELAISPVLFKISSFKDITLNQFFKYLVNNKVISNVALSHDFIAIECMRAMSTLNIASVCGDSNYMVYRIKNYNEFLSILAAYKLQNIRR